MTRDQGSGIRDQKSRRPLLQCCAILRAICERVGAASLAAIACLLLVTGCRQDMHNQPN